MIINNNSSKKNYKKQLCMFSIGTQITSLKNNLTNCLPYFKNIIPLKFRFKVIKCFSLELL